MAIALDFRDVLSCSQNSSWATNQTAYIQASTDSGVRSWWASVPHTNFANQLGASFGDHLTGFDCGIGLEEICVLPGCSPFQTNGDPVWAFLAENSIVNLNEYLNDLFTEVTNAQADFTDQIDAIVTTFFPPSDQSFPLGQGMPWISAIISLVFGLGGLIPGVGVAERLGNVGLSSIGYLVGAGFTMGTNNLQPSPGSDLDTVQDMQTFCKNISETTRDILSSWANSTFIGTADVNNHTILDYLQNGSFIDSSVIPSRGGFEDMFLEQFTSRYINQKWRTQTIFVMFSPTAGPNDTSGPAETMYYSKVDDGAYYLYQFYDDGSGAYHLDQPLNMNNLSQYQISGNDITESSAGAFRAASFNFTNNDALSLLQNALANSSAPNPYILRSAWPGTWTFPVCDTGAYNWNSQYNSASPPLPCCCGDSCADTAAFVNASNLFGSQTYLEACQTQLANTTLNFTLIDYGFNISNTERDLGTRLYAAGIAISCMLSGIVLIGCVFACAGHGEVCGAFFAISVFLFLIISVPLFSVGARDYGS